MLSKNRDIASRSTESSAPGFASSFSGQLVWSHMVDPSVLSTKDKVQLSGLSVLHVGLIGVLIDDVLTMAIASDYKAKYIHLLHELSKCKVLTLSKGIYEHLNSGKPADFDNEFNELKRKLSSLSIEKMNNIVYVQPRNQDKGEKDKSKESDITHIYFKEFANFIRGKGVMGKVFAEYLGKWEEPAGESDPRPK